MRSALLLFLAWTAFAAPPAICPLFVSGASDRFEVAYKAVLDHIDKNMPFEQRNALIAKMDESKKYFDIESSDVVSAQVSAALKSIEIEAAKAGQQNALTAVAEKMIRERLDAGKTTEATVREVKEYTAEQDHALLKKVIRVPELANFDGQKGNTTRTSSSVVDQFTAHQSRNVAIFVRTLAKWGGPHTGWELGWVDLDAKTVGAVQYPLENSRGKFFEALRFDHANTRALWLGPDKEVRVLDLASKKTETLSLSPLGLHRTIAVFGDGKRVAVANDSKRVDLEIWDVDSKKIVSQEKIKLSWAERYQRKGQHFSNVLVSGYKGEKAFFGARFSESRIFDADGKKIMLSGLKNAGIDKKASLVFVKDAFWAGQGDDNLVLTVEWNDGLIPYTTVKFWDPYKRTASARIRVDAKTGQVLGLWKDFEGQTPLDRPGHTPWTKYYKASGDFVVLYDGEKGIELERYKVVKPSKGHSLDTLSPDGKDIWLFEVYTGQISKYSVE